MAWTKPTVLNGLSRDLVVGVLVVLALDLHDDVVALSEAGVASGLEAIAASSTGVSGGEGRTVAVLVDVGANELVELHSRRCWGGMGGGFGWKAAHVGVLYTRRRR